MNRNSGPKLSKAELQAQADAALAMFKGQGKAVQQMPAVESKQFVCSFCGTVSTLGVRAGQKVRCPRCRNELPNPA
jgi:hypothetical protein